jgi:hypothetical protein
MKRSALTKAITALEERIRILELAKAELLKLAADKPKLRGFAVAKTAKEPAYRELPDHQQGVTLSGQSLHPTPRSVPKEPA